MDPHTELIHSTMDPHTEFLPPKNYQGLKLITHGSGAGPHPSCFRVKGMKWNDYLQYPPSRPTPFLIFSLLDQYNSKHSQL